MNMALADEMLGAVSLPLYVYLVIGSNHLLWTAKANTSMLYFYHFLDATFSQSSLISAGFISCERFMPHIGHLNTKQCQCGSIALLFL